MRLASAAVLLVMAAQGSTPVPAAGQVPLSPLAVTQLDDRQPATDLDSARPVSIIVSEPVAIGDLLLMLVRDTRLSVVPDPDVQGTFRGELKDVTLRQALEMILQPHGYEYSMQGSVIRVFKRRLETRRFDLNYVITRRVASRTLSASNAIAPGGSGVSTPAGRHGSGVDASATDAGDIFADLSAGVQTLLSPEGRFNLDRKAPLLQATDYADRLDQIQLYLDAVHDRATRQVQIQAKVIQVALNDAFAAGIDWPLLIKRAGDSVALTQNAAPTSGGAMTVGLNVKDFAGLLAAFASQGKANVIASPTVNALNNEPLIMRVGTQDVFFRTTTHADAATGRIVQTSVEPQAITEGILLSVTPQISSDGMISMSITPSVTERTGQAMSRFGDTAPILSVRETDTLVRVRESETIVIAGLLEEKTTYAEKKMPVLGSLPGVGAIFRSETPSRQKIDLVILLTPRVLKATELERVSTR